MAKPLILEIGANIRPQAQYVWKDATIKYMDIDPRFKPDYLCDSREPPAELKGTFDGLFASHVLEHFVYRESVLVLQVWKSLIKPGAQMHIIVPALEWVAEAVFKGREGVATLPHLHGGISTEHDIHLTSFTMRSLRNAMEQAGLGVCHAKTVDYNIKVIDKTYPAKQHYVIGVNK